MYDWKDIPEGYYAVPDPRDGVDEITYWRKDDGKGGGQAFGAWPKKARYGPQLTREDLPAGQRTEEGREFIYEWREKVMKPYMDAVIVAIAADPVAAGQRFADWTIRCCCCGKALTNDLSKVYGIGPECRRSLPEGVLANYVRSEVGQLHAQCV